MLKFDRTPNKVLTALRISTRMITIFQPIVILFNFSNTFKLKSNMKCQCSAILLKIPSLKYSGFLIKVEPRNH